MGETQGQLNQLTAPLQGKGLEPMMMKANLRTNPTGPALSRGEQEALQIQATGVNGRAPGAQPSECAVLEQALVVEGEGQLHQVEQSRIDAIQI